MILPKIIQSFSKLERLVPKIARNYATIVERELEVPTFCDLHIHIPYSVYVKPLNVHKYHNCDKLILKFDEKVQDTLEYDLNGNQITIVDNGKCKDTEAIQLYVKAPVKANLYINAQKDIKVGYFHGDKLYLESVNGDINIDKYQGDVVRLITHRGNIDINDFIQASDIDGAVMEEGNITTGRCQSLNLKLQTKLGNISVESCYSHDSHFIACKGSMDLHNIHKSCTIFIENGNLGLTGFDGKLKTVIDRGCASIHLARITDKSEINVMKGSLNLKLSEACQDNTAFEIRTLDYEIVDSVKMIAKNDEGALHLIPDHINNEQNLVKINCMQGSVDIDAGSWKDMMKLKLKKNNLQ